MTPWDSRHTHLTHTSRPALQSSLFKLSCSLLYSFCCRTHEVGFHQFLCTFWILHLIIKKTPKMSAFKPGWGGTRWHLNEEETLMVVRRRKKRLENEERGVLYLSVVARAWTRRMWWCEGGWGGRGTVGVQAGLHLIFFLFSEPFQDFSFFYFSFSTHR